MNVSEAGRFAVLMSSVFWRVFSSWGQALRVRQELWMPELLTRQHRDVWQAEGAKDMAQRVRERLHDLIDGHQVRPLPDKTLATLARLKRAGEAKLTKE